MNFIKEVKVKSLSRVWLCDPVDCSPPGSSVHGTVQARIQEWVAISFSRGSSWPRDPTQVSCMQADSLLSEPPGKPKEVVSAIIGVVTNFTPEKNLPWIQLSWPDKSAVHVAYSLWRDTNLLWSAILALHHSAILKLWGRGILGDF